MCPVCYKTCWTTSTDPMEEMSMYLWVISLRKKAAKTDWSSQVPDCNAWSTAKFSLKSKDNAILGLNHRTRIRLHKMTKEGTFYFSTVWQHVQGTVTSHIIHSQKKGNQEMGSWTSRTWQYTLMDSESRLHTHRWREGTQTPTYLVKNIKWHSSNLSTHFTETRARRKITFRVTSLPRVLQNGPYKALLRFSRKRVASHLGEKTSQEDKDFL